MAGSGSGVPITSSGVTVSDVLTIARRYLKDADKVYWTDAVLYPHLNSAQQDLSRDRPDLLLNSSEVVQTLVTASALTDVLTFTAAWANALALKTAVYALMEDSADTENASRAEVWNTLYKQEIRVG